MRLTRSRYAATLLVCALLAGLALYVAVTMGPTAPSLDAAVQALREPSLRAGSVDYETVFRLRLPRAVLGLLVGLGLGIAGAALQAVLRNPLADPYVLGISTGSAVGAVLAMSVGFRYALGPLSSVELCALLGGGFVMTLLYALARRSAEFAMTGLLLCGVALALTGSSAILLIRYFASPTLLVVMDRWVMGGLGVVGWDEVVSLIPLLCVGCLTLLWLAPSLNQVTFGTELAAGRGVDPARLQKHAFVATSLITAAVVSLAGPIGFVGLIVPHAVRRVIGPDHRILLPAAGLVAGAFLTLCDTLARTVIAPTELPVGIVTAVVGGPVFIAILVRRRH